MCLAPFGWTSVFAADAGAGPTIEEVIVTGSRIRQNPLDAPAPVLEITEADLQQTGLSSLADNLQRLPGMGSALNTRFNSSGNFGSTQPGEGVGAGSAQVNMRHLGSKRTLVLVDGLRWVNAASATGMPAAPDLNTIPVNIIERVEILQDGASAIYGSDAIGGVVNIITKKDFEGFSLNAKAGQFLSDNDGETYDLSALFGAVGDRSRVSLSLSWVDQDLVRSIDRDETEVFQKPPFCGLKRPYFAIVVSISDLGAIGEFVGYLAVLATLA